MSGDKKPQKTTPQMLEDLDKRVSRIEKVVWVVLGMLLAKAGIDLPTLVSALKP